MGRAFGTALRDRPLVFEPVPPGARASPARSEAHLRELVDLVQGLPRIDAVNIPELVDENHDGRPYYRSGDPRRFARELVDRTGAEIIVNKVVAHMASGRALETWARETIDRGIRHLVLVGGSSRYIPYPGPSVAEANRVCRPILDGANGHLGNIAIPQRTGEPHRMVLKIRSGATFFTTQIVFDAEAAVRMVREYGRLCGESGIDPAPVLLSVAPIADDGDAQFVRWLGADISDAAERAILNGDDAGAGARSIDRALSVWRTVRDATPPTGPRVPLGLNVEQISQRHLGIAGEMVRAFAKELGSTRPTAA